MAKRILIFDPIPFKGGSKVATNDALAQCDNRKCSFIVATVDVNYWQASALCSSHNVKIISLPSLEWLNKQHNGLGYWLNQIWFASLLALVAVTHLRVHKVVGASGPGIDMPLYLLQRLFFWQVIQFVHGNVGYSRSIGYCLTQADKVFYLPTTQPSLQAALECYLSGKGQSLRKASQQASKYLDSSNYQSFANGIPKSRWPSKAQSDTPHLFWAASLLKWKGLDLFTQAVSSTTYTSDLHTTVCYIKPKQITLEVSQAPVELNNCSWFEDPEHLDSLRSDCNIFVSTSRNEPFGLSILEAMAAGMCVVIPSDGSYWDTMLTHGQNCIKYCSGDAESLAASIKSLAHSPELIKQCGDRAFALAQQYSAEKQYADFASALSANTSNPSTSYRGAEHDAH